MTKQAQRLNRQQGASAIEFAFVFPLLFAITYSAVVYGYIFYTQQSLNFVSQEAARSVVRVDPASNNYSSLLSTAANASVAQSLVYSPLIAKAAITSSIVAGTDASGNPTRTITVQMPTAALQASGFASIPLPFVGAFPPLPALLTASTVVRVN